MMLGNKNNFKLGSTVNCGGDEYVVEDVIFDYYSGEERYLLINVTTGQQKIVSQTEIMKALIG